MIVPDFWAEARVQHRAGGRQVTVRRFGWSDASQDDAQAMAERRAQEALAEILSGQALPRSEPRAGYNGADGVPIREEVLARHGNDVITRNSYGAHCLNTPSVLFADIDFTEPPEPHVAARPPQVIAVVCGLLLFAITGKLVFGVAGAFAAYCLACRLVPAKPIPAAEPETAAMQRIEAYATRNPQQSLRVYRTPAGLRVLATHSTFDPRGGDAATLFQAIGVDTVYAVMCRNQNCFRARLSAKPWRIGITRHIKPRGRAWPLAADVLARRQPWIEEYERCASGYAACRFLRTLGSDTVHPDVAATLELHDRLSGAIREQPIA